jgi:PAS domain S-box-containing protein
VVKPSQPLPSSGSALALWHGFLDRVDDPLLLLDERAFVTFANTAALRVLPCEPGTALRSLSSQLGEELTDWVSRTLGGDARAGAPPVGARGAGLSRLNAHRWALHLPAGLARREPADAPSLSSPAFIELRRMFWDSPFPAALQDDDFRLVDVNQAFVDFIGLPRERLLGADPIEFVPDADRPEVEGVREVLRADFRSPELPDLIDRRFLDAHGRERWFRAARRRVNDETGRALTLSVMQESTAEHVAREQADRSVRELDEWFELSPVGMVVYDDSGLVLRSNRVFEALVGSAPVLVGEAAEPLRTLLGAPRGVEDGEALERRGWVRDAQGRERLLRSRVRRLQPHADGASRRCIAVVEDLTAEEERDLAHGRNEELLRELASILESTTAGIAYLRGDTLVRCNRRFERMLGLSAGMLAGMSVHELFARHAHLAPVLEETEEALRESGVFETEIPVHLPGRPTQWLALSARRVGSGEDSEVVAVLSDITRLKRQQGELEALAQEREQAQSTLAEQASLTRAILDSVFVGIVTVGPQGIEWMNRSARRMFGGGLDIFYHRPLASVAPHDPAHPFLQAVPGKAESEDLQEGQVRGFECRVQALDGREFWVVGNAVATRRGDDPSPQVTYALLDIDRRREAEARTQRAQASLRRVIDLAPLGIVLFDARSTRIKQVNPVAGGLFGATAGALEGLEIEHIAGPIDGRTMREDMGASLERREAAVREYRFSDAQGEHVWEARYLALAEPERDPDEVLLVMTDVTEQRVVEAQRLQAAIAQRDLLVKEVHHRIKNNLQGVAGLLAQSARRTPEVAGAIEEAVRQVQAIAQVYGLQVGAEGPLGLRPLVEAIARNVQRTSGHDIVLSGVDNPGALERWALPEAEAIPVALSLNELFGNAIRHGGAAQVSCSIAADEEAVHIDIRNQGRLPSGFDAAQGGSGVSGLGLVRALLPRRSATLAMRQEGEQVLARVSLSAPGLLRRN